MASSAGVSSSAPRPRIKSGVAPLRAGQGSSFLLRRLHSLCGIFPIGFFLLEHFVSNAFATNGPEAYGHQVKFLTSVPFLTLVEASFIWAPIAFHGLYGLWIWWKGEANVAYYPWSGNWLYSAQRYTGILALAYMGWHTYTMRFTGLHLIGNAQMSFAKVQAELQHPYAVVFYVIGITAASWHFSYGIWLFCAKWGITTGERSRRLLGAVCFLLALGLIGAGLYTLWAFFLPQWQNEWLRMPAESGALWNAARNLIA